MRIDYLKPLMLAGLVLAGGTTGLRAELTKSYQFNGKGNWSIDGLGGNGTPVGLLQASIPVGATVQKAYLYSSLWSFSGAISTPSVTFESTTYSGGAWTPLGSYQPQPGPNPNFYLGAFRADVTAQVAGLAGPGSAALFNWTVNSETPNGNVDGEVLAVVYSLPTESTRTIAFLDGYSTSTGDTTTVTFAAPLSAAELAAADFQASLSLGIGFSAGGSQFSTVNINATRLTSSAGGFDDGVGTNGGLITVGGIGDNPANPADPNSNSSADDELYTLNSYLTAGMTSFNVVTQNPSLDDNIFFAGLNITATAGVTTGVPDHASTLLLLSAVFSGLGLCRRALGKRA